MCLVTGLANFPRTAPDQSIISGISLRSISSSDLAASASSSFACCFLVNITFSLTWSGFSRRYDSDHFSALVRYRMSNGQNTPPALPRACHRSSPSTTRSGNVTKCGFVKNELRAFKADSVLRAVRFVLPLIPFKHHKYAHRSTQSTPKDSSISLCRTAQHRYPPSSGPPPRHRPNSSCRPDTTMSRFQHQCRHRSPPRRHRSRSRSNSPPKFREVGWLVRTIRC